MNIRQPHSHKVSYTEYLSWPDEPRYEIIAGEPYMQAAPSRGHQRIVSYQTHLFPALEVMVKDIFS